MAHLVVHRFLFDGSYPWPILSPGIVLRLGFGSIDQSVLVTVAKKIKEKVGHGLYHCAK